jgi:DNA-binding NtrC family response regulator
LPEPALKFDVLLVDDQPGQDRWGEITKTLLEQFEFSVTHVRKVEEAKEKLRVTSFDILIIDVDLQSPVNGLDLQIQIRKMGIRQPVILVTGNSDYLSDPISTYADALASGPVSFFDKRSQMDFVSLVRDVSNRVDPIRRVLRLMNSAGLGDKTFSVHGGEYSVSQLLIESPTNDELVRSLRESLYALIIELQAKVTQNESVSDRSP